MNDGILETVDIAKLIPHRYPFLLVDRVLRWDKGKTITALKNVTANEPFFPGHFPSEPIMPGVLVIEAMAQTCGLLAKLSFEKAQGDAPMYFAGVTRARFKRKVVPGDTLTFEAELLRVRQTMLQAVCTAKVGDELACSAELLLALEA